MKKLRLILNFMIRRLFNSEASLELINLTYRYRYQSKFYHWLPVFLEKAQTTGMNKNLLFVAGMSCCYLFVSL